VSTGPRIGHVQPADAKAFEVSIWRVAASAQMRVIGRMRATVGSGADRMAMPVTVPSQVVAGTCDLSQFCHAM
jgi:hypothetical protein